MTSRSNNLAIGCVVLFCLPFCGVGVVAAVLAVHSALKGDRTAALMTSVFALVFGGAGFGILTMTLRGRKLLAATDALQASHPEEPWLWRADWAARRVTDSNQSGMFGAWAFATFWNLIALPAGGFAIVQTFKQRQLTPMLFVLLFPLVGIGLLAWAVHATLRYRRYGVSVFEPAAVPAPVGRQLAGLIRTAHDVAPPAGYQLALRCINQVRTGSGDNRSTSENVVWEERQTIPSASPQAEGVVIPVLVAIPADARQTDESNPDNKIIWRLTVSAEVPGVDYEASFEVPVFRTSESDTPLSEEARRALDPTTVPANYRPAAGSGIIVTDGAGGIEFYYPAARNLGVALGILVFTLIWLGAIYGMIAVGAPIIFPLVFGGFAVLLLLVLFQMLLVTKSVRVNAGELIITTGLAGGVTLSRESIQSKDITDVTIAMGTRSGTHVYYDLTLVDRAGAKHGGGSGVPDKREAEWLAWKLKRALELVPPESGGPAPAG